MIAAAAGYGLMLVAALAFIRLLRGPHDVDRAAAAHVISIVAILMICALGAIARNDAWADIAIAVALSLAVACVATLKAFRTGALQTPLADLGAPQPRGAAPEEGA